MIFRLILIHFLVTPPQALHSSHTIALSKGYHFQQKKKKKKRKKNADFFQKNAHITQNGPRESPSRLGIRVKDLTKIRNCGKFHHYRNCSSQGKNFQSITSASTKWLFSGFFILGPYSPKYNPILMKFSPQVVLKQTVFCSSWYTLGQGQRINRNFYIANRIWIFP